MIVRYLGGRQFEIEHRGHRVLTDQPHDRGGEDQALTPTELFVGSLAACTALYAASVAHRHGLQRGDLTVEAQWHTDEGENRVEGISLVLAFARPVARDIMEAVRRAAEQCLVHRSIKTAPQITVEVLVRSGVPGQ